METTTTLTTRAARMFDEHFGAEEAMDAAEYWGDPDPVLSDHEREIMLARIERDLAFDGRDALLSDIDVHWQTGEPIWEVEYYEGFRRWLPEAEAKRVLGIA